MDDEKKWNLNAPQNDTENNRQNEPPRYEHYCMHQNTESDTVKELLEKKKNKKRGGKKLAETISLAVVFGLVAGAVFQGVNFASEKYLGSDGKDSQIETAQLAADSSADGNDLNESKEMLQVKLPLRKQQLLCHRRVLLQKLQIQQCQR